jgi:protease-4
MMWHELRSFRRQVPLPMVACMMDVATGGAYYLAAAADVICAYPGTVTGGIGVILNVYNLQDAMAQYNVLNQPIKAGQHIDMGSALEAMSPEVRDWLQAMADEYHQRFQQAVLDRRPRVARDDATTFDGRIFTATQAIERGLIDELGTLDDAIAMARQMAQRENACAVMYHRCVDAARSPYAITANAPSFNNLLPISLPGFERSRLPTFLYMWEPDPTLERSRAY